jgi:hypothetical protein
MVFSSSLSGRIQKQEAGREKRLASRGYGNLQMVNPAKRLECCPTRFPLPWKGLSCDEATIVQTINIIFVVKNKTRGRVRELWKTPGHFGSSGEGKIIRVENQTPGVFAPGFMYLQQ